MTLIALSLFASASAFAADTVYFNGDAYLQTGEQGRYHLSTTASGPLGGDCYSQEGGSHSLFTANGDWVMIDAADCDTSSYTMWTALYTASSDPTTTPYIDCEPDAVELTNLNSSYDEGDYELSSDPGDSDFECYNRVDGARSLGSFYGSWYVIDAPDCELASATWFNRITTTGTCDPTDDFVAFPLY
ncbi:MAG: hypothetical protein H6741_33550 [Alphaproteobacteria bacterium]|nr:hypothetical protein [Alphaproteobacteria bacterium]